mmetsp:Transcript_15446/g.42581  ORF Transcript_15446/g.42581 Transcript_15446/m.42581 type:complete len:225 (+) Transcript_15446:192-866(+)
MLATEVDVLIAINRPDLGGAEIPHFLLCSSPPIPYPHALCPALAALHATGRVEEHEPSFVLLALHARRPMGFAEFHDLRLCPEGRMRICLTALGGSAPLLLLSHLLDVFIRLCPGLVFPLAVYIEQVKLLGPPLVHGVPRGHAARALFALEQARPSPRLLLLDFDCHAAGRGKAPRPHTGIHILVEFQVQCIALAQLRVHAGRREVEAARCDLNTLIVNLECSR